MSTYPKKEFSELLDDYYHRLVVAQKSHYTQCEVHHWWDVALSIVLTFSSTIVAVFLFFDFANNEPSIKVTIILLSITAAILAAIQPQFKLAEKAEVHRAKAVQYGQLRREIEVFIADETDNIQKQKFLFSFRKKWNEVAIDAPVTPKAVRYSVKG